MTEPTEITAESSLEKSLQRLHRSTGMFSSLLVFAVAVVFASSVWTNYKVITLTSGLRRTQAHLVTVQRQDAENTRRARFESCKGSNHDKIAGAHKDIRLSHDTVLALIRGVPDQAAAHVAAHAFNVKHDELIRASYKHRDCSAAGIARYLGIPLKH